MRLIIYILILGLIGCSNQITDKTSKLSSSKDSTDCPTKQFLKQAGEFRIQAIYADCESDWKYGLTVYKNNKLIYAADSLMEFEFKNSKFPDYIGVSKDTSQILLEVNDRPLTNYILCLTIAKDNVISKVRMPLFENDPKDYDHDGLLEYSGYSYTTEGYTNDSCYYNPIIFVEKGHNGFHLDNDLIKSVNSNLYGNYYGLEPDENIKLKIPQIDSLKKYAND